MVKKVELLSDACKADIDRWLAKYPLDQRRSALLPALHRVQAENKGHLTNLLIEATADYLQIPAIWAFEVATFYSMYELQPVGQYKIGVCSSISCHLMGAPKLNEHLQQTLGVKFGETTPDGKFTLKHVECLGACVGGPVVQINQEYYENMSPEAIDHILKELP